MRRDTDPAVESHYRRLMAAKSGSDRVRMMADMMDDGRRILLSRYGGPPEEEREWLFVELYGRELPDWYVTDCLRWLRKRREARVAHEP